MGMGMHVEIRKKHDDEFYIDCIKPSKRSDYFIEMSTECINETKDKCKHTSCFMCDCSYDNRFKIEKETGYDEIDEIIRDQGYVWLSFDY